MALGIGLALIRPRAPRTARIVAKKMDVTERRIVTATPWNTMTGPERRANSQSQASAMARPMPTRVMMNTQTKTNVNRKRSLAARRASATSPTIGASVGVTRPTSVPSPAITSPGPCGDATRREGAGATPAFRQLGPMLLLDAVVDALVPLV